MSPELWAELWISVKSMRSKFVLPVLKKETKKNPYTDLRVEKF